MREVWLRPNRRAGLLGLVPPGVFAVAGLIIVWAIPHDHHLAAIRWLGWLMLVLSGLPVAAILFWLRQPRLSYGDGHLIVNLQAGQPVRVPIQLVECFFLGQGPALVGTKTDNDPETRNVVVRLADRADRWKNHEVKPQLGQWCDGYITIRGTWCEPLTAELLKQMNHRLAAVHREHRNSGEQPTA